jgi:DNA-binding transcriptional regulator YiaG
MRQTTTAELRLDEGKARSSGAVRPSDSLFWLPPGRLRSNFVAARLAETEIAPNGFGIRRMSVESISLQQRVCLAAASTFEGSRAARGWLGWSQRELATRAGVSLNTVHEFEIGRRTTTANNIAAMRRAIEAAGIRLVFDQNGTAAGILRQDANPDLSRDSPG